MLRLPGTVTHVPVTCHLSGVTYVVNSDTSGRAIVEWARSDAGGATRPSVIPRLACGLTTIRNATITRRISIAVAPLCPRGQAGQLGRRALGRWWR